jgi:hypothetical protein
MAKFARFYGVDRNAYHINVEQIAWVFRPMGARHTVIRMCGTSDALSVIQTPEQIIAELDSGEHEDDTMTGRPRMGAGASRTPARSRTQQDISS